MPEPTYSFSPEYLKLFNDILDFARDYVAAEGGERRRRVRYWSALALLRCVSSSPAAAAATLRSRATVDQADEEDIDEIGRRTVLDHGDDDSVVLDLNPGSDTAGTAENTRRALLEFARRAEALPVSADHKLQGAIREVVDPGVAPSITAVPAAVTIVSNDRAQLKVTATGNSALTYQWYQGASGNTSAPVAGATSASFTTPMLVTTTSYWVRIADANGNVTNSPSATVTVSASSPLTVAQSVMGHGYMAGGAVTVKNTISYAGTAPSRIDWVTLLPSGWKYVGSGGGEGGTRPVYKAADLLEWSWVTVPASPIEFTYTVSVPAGVTADQVIAALVTSVQAGTTFQTMAKPDPLVLRSASLHTADSNRDGRISLLELTRVIELYNYKSGTTRTGNYHAQAGTEDGYTPGP